jgi:uncharacterized protein (DUF1684 family)
MRKPTQNFLKVIVLLSLMGNFSCNDGKRYRAASKPSQVKATGGLAEIIAFQDALNETFSDPDNSPLPDRYRIHFNGLDFFPPDTTYQVWARLIRTPEALPFSMPTTTDRLALERKYGTLVFDLQGQALALEVYQSPDLILEEDYVDYLFLPFADATNGAETYTGGRYIDLRIPASDSILIDFNKAYNPYCAYNPKYSCPIVPKQNRLPIPVRAGVKAFDPK